MSILVTGGAGFIGSALVRRLVGRGRETVVNVDALTYAGDPARVAACQASPIYGRGENVRDWLHVDDHVDALLLALEHGRPGECYNVGGHGECTNLALIEHLCAILDDMRPEGPVVPHRSLIRFVEDRPGHDLRYAIDAGRIRGTLGWRTRVDLDSGLRATVAWYGEHLDWCESIARERYAGVRLGLARGTPPVALPGALRAPEGGASRG